MSLNVNLRTLRGGRKLTVAERAIAAVTASLALASMALAVAGAARASTPAGVLPVDGAYQYQPLKTASHAAATPAPQLPDVVPGPVPATR